jgi:hypothetical protein
MSEPLDPRPPTAHGPVPFRFAWGWLVLWAGFVAYAAFAAPPDDPELTSALVRGAFTGRFDGIDPSIAAVFSLLGVVPVLAASFVLRDGSTRRVPAWPFAMAMFAVGAFALLPWLAFRRLGTPLEPPRSPNVVRRILASRIAAAGIVVALIALTCWAVFSGSSAAYLSAFRRTSMVNVMSVDFVICGALLYVLMEEARAEVGPEEEPAFARVVRFVPVLGPALWSLLVRRAP